MAVVVTYHPDSGKLFELLSALAPQVTSIVIVDNGSDARVLDSVLGTCLNEVELIFLERNLGIAAAQNIGISRAKEMQAEYVLLSDQDSVPDHLMVHELLKAAEKISVEQGQPACFGPRYLDSRQKNPPPFLRIRGFKLERCICATEDSIVPVDYLIASGCLIPMSVLERVGGMREDFFIDYVDIEWGLRARRLGYQSYGVCAAKMAHTLGDEPVNFFGKNIPLHSPLRHYYHFRNAVALYKEGWVPGNWKMVDGWRLCLKYVFYSLFVKSRVEQWRMMTIGVWHGLRGRAGKFGGGMS